MNAAARAAGRYIDLKGAPFTLPGSRILVQRAGDDLRVCTAEYERPPTDCLVVKLMHVRSRSRGRLPLGEVMPESIDLGGEVSVTFDGVCALSIGNSAFEGAASDDLELVIVLSDHLERVVPIDAGAIRLHVDADRTLRIEVGSDHAGALQRTKRAWREWFQRCPEVRPDLQDMTAFCWWVLGANIVTLPAPANARAVVPSKIGYVGLWQWDAYFIAVGLRHGDLRLAREQLEVAFRFPSDTGQLPDVVHTFGVLASSEDLPEADRETLRRAGSSISDPVAPIPLTKPPLAAWALRKVLDVAPDDDAWARRLLPVVRRSQEWWFSHSDVDGDGIPEYGHPYSSGLDDSPVFDRSLPTTTPDLLSYLILQDEVLADLGTRFGDGANAAAAHHARRNDTLRSLLTLWSDPLGRFVSLSGGHQIESHTVLGLLPLLTGLLPDGIRQRVHAELRDPEAFASRWRVPTVARSDPDYSPERMWRGPVWININTLLVEGLDASGYAADAEALAEATVRLVIHAGGPHEYFNPETGDKATAATTAFSWSAALFIDLAVRLSS